MAREPEDDKKHFEDFGESGFDLVVEDMVPLSRIAREENPRPSISPGRSATSTIVQVEQLAFPQFMVEIKCTAEV